MQRSPTTRTYIDAQHFPGGVNSYLEPQLLGETQVRWAVNAVNRGGVWQTRPGFRTLFDFKVGTGEQFNTWWEAAGKPKIHPQFATLFTPTGGSTYIVFGVSGSVFAARSNGRSGFDTPLLLTHIQFDPQAPRICACATIRSSAPNPDGTRSTITPRKYLIMQDGCGRAAFWDGVQDAHLDPEPSYTTDKDGNTIYTMGKNQTKQGLWMAWSGNRLWVARGSQVFASDLCDPLYFTESTVLTAVPVFNFESEVTGLADRGTSGVQQNVLLVFTHNSTYVLRSGIQQRAATYNTDGTQASSGWSDVEDFQRKIFADVGCVAGKSVINHKGLMYWYSEGGVVKFDSTGTVYSTQSLPPMDTENAVVKQRLASDLSSICAASRENYAMWSLPVGPINPNNGMSYAGPTMVYDTNIIPVGGGDGGLKGWQGVWTGVNPVEWFSGRIDSRVVTGVLSMDSDGIIRIHEAFQGNRSDNGQPIPWSIETRTHAVTTTPFARSVFRHMAAKLVGVRGNVGVKGYWKATRGVYHKLLDTTLTAATGPLFLNGSVYSDSKVEDWKRQTRYLISEDSRGPEDGGTSMGVESPLTDQVDTAFSLLFEFTGVAALLAYRLAVDAQADNTEGAVMEDETGIRILPEVGTPSVTDGNPTYVMGESIADPFTPIDPTTTDDAYSVPVES